MGEGARGGDHEGSGRRAGQSVVVSLDGRAGRGLTPPCAGVEKRPPPQAGIVIERAREPRGACHISSGA